MTPVRSIVLEIPDWPVAAYTRASGADPGEPLAVVRANTVVSCSPAARAEGVRLGRRRRDAQARCPGLGIVADDPARDIREFLPAVRLVEELTPGVQIVRPGVCALRARGPARYYGGEEQAVRVLLDALAAEGFGDARSGVADGLFTAEQAAKTTNPDHPMRIVPAGGAPQFLSRLPVAVLGDPELADLLMRLGVLTLGAFAALDHEQVGARLGERGMRLHVLAAGGDPSPVVPRTPPPELAREIAFDPPLEAAEQVAFAVRTTADSVIAAVDAAALVCTEVRIELSDEDGGRSERVWQHPECFTAAEIVDRVRWQLEAAAGDAAGLVGPVAHARIVPEAVDAASRHQPGLLGQGGDERLHHALSRVQSILGHRGVLTPAIGGGRWLAERQVLVPWGDRAPAADQQQRPWPGSLPAPLPATVFAQPLPAEVRAHDAQLVAVDARGTLSAPPASLAVEGMRSAVTAWAGPWPIREREWDAAHRRVAHRFQAVDASQTAWLLFLEDGQWWVEGRYD